MKHIVQELDSWPTCRSRGSGVCSSSSKTAIPDPGLTQSTCFVLRPPGHSGCTSRSCKDSVQLTNHEGTTSSTSSWWWRRPQPILSRVNEPLWVCSAVWSNYCFVDSQLLFMAHSVLCHHNTSQNTRSDVWMSGGLSWQHAPPCSHAAVGGVSLQASVPASVIQRGSGTEGRQAWHW